MSKFKEFEEKFEQDYKTIYDFIISADSHDIPYNGRLEATNDQIAYDSYGDESSKLERIYYFIDFDIYVGFYGYRRSYDGEYWSNFREVNKVTKYINTYE